MAVRIGSFLLLLLTACAHQETSSPTAVDSGKIEYSIQVNLGAVPELMVEASFQGNATGKSQFSLPKDLYENKKLFDGIRDLKVVSPNGQLSSADANGFSQVTYPPGSQVTLQYRLIQTAKEFKNTSPMISNQFFHINGQTLFAHPNWTHDQPVQAEVRWVNIPPGWIVANSFGAAELIQHIATTAFNFTTSIFVAGNFDLQKIEIKGKPVYIAIRGKWDFNHQSAVELIRRVITAQRDFWHDFAVPYYFVLMMSNGQPCCGFGGHGLTHSFVSYFSPDDGDLKRFGWVLAHEHFHYWNGEKMEAESDGPEYWFTEGFTDYYPRLLNLRAGVNTYAEFIDDINGQIYRYYSDPQRAITNAEIGGSSRIPQIKGNVFAGEWNVAIRQATNNQKTLDDFMHEVLRSLGSAKLTNAHIETELAQLISPARAAQLLQEVFSGAMIHPSDGALGPCVHVEDWETGKYQAGFQDAMGATVIANLIPHSNAERAGLREGQKIVSKRNIDYYKPWLPIDLQIEGEHGLRWIHFLPQGRENLKYPHFVIDPHRSSTKCVKWLGGTGQLFQSR